MVNPLFMDYEYQYSIKLKKVEEEILKAFPEKADRSWIQSFTGEPAPLGALQDYDAFCEPARELLFRGGKRWRPVMMLLACELTGGGEEALPFVPVVEFPHNGSLIIDDIEDNSPRRRGGQSMHIAYGEDLAINAGNLLYFLPAQIIENAALSDHMKGKLFTYYTENMRRLHFGQGFDILWHRRKEYIPSPEEYEQMCRFKTGSLARMAAQIGAAMGGGSDADIALLGSVCEDMGVGFQIMDDVVNVTTGNPGKGRGDDIVEGKKSLPVIFHLAEHPGDKPVFLDLFTRAAAKGFAHAEDEIEKAIGLMERSGAVAKAKTRGTKLLLYASDRIGKAFGSSNAAQIMRGMIQKFAESY